MLRARMGWLRVAKCLRTCVASGAPAVADSEAAVRGRSGRESGLLLPMQVSYTES